MRARKHLKANIKQKESEQWHSTLKPMAFEVVPGTQRDASELEVCVVEINVKENNG